MIRCPDRHPHVPMKLSQWYGLMAILFLLQLCPAGVVARQPQPFTSQYVIHYDDENGLPSNDVTGFGEDNNGYYWFATQSGVVRFDGREFRHFHTRNVPTLSSNRIYSINRDAAGNLLFPDESTGIHAIKPDGQIVPVGGAVARHNYLTSRHGYVVDMRTYLENKADSARIMEELVATKYYTAMQEFYPDDKGNVWFISGEDISYFSKGHFQRVDRYDLKTYQHFFVKSTLFTVDAAGNIQAYSEGKKTNYTASLQQLLLPLKETARFNRQQSSFCSNATGAFLQFRDKLYTFGFNGQTLQPTLLLQQIQLPLVKDIFYSARYRLYIAITSTNGFYLIKDQPFTVRRFREGLENNFYAAAEIEPMKVLASNGVLFTKDTAKRIYSYDYMVTNAILKDRQQQLWFVAGDTLFCMNSKLQEVKRWMIKDTYLASMQQDEQGIIWFSTNNGMGRVVDGKLETIYSQNYTFGRTQCMFLLNDTTIWLGTTKGLYAFNKKSKTITPIETMQGRYVRHMYSAKDGSLWIGTYGDGYYTYRNGRFIELPQDRMGYLAYAHCFMEDDKGFFWIPTNKGLFQVPKQALESWLQNGDQQVYYYYYDKNDGFGTNEFNGGTSPVGIRLQDGTFSLPSMKGLVWFNPLHVKPFLPAQDIHVDRVMVDTQEIRYTGNLAFNPGSRKMSFRINSPYFGNTANFQPEYRIGGVDNLWTPVPSDNNIVINYLPPGKYTLDIRLRRGFEADAYTTKSLPFSITPHWYETLLFKTLLSLIILLLLAVAVYGYNKRQAQKNKKRELDLERQVRERTQEQAITVEKLEQAVQELRTSEENLHQSNLLKDKLTSVILHDIRSPLRFMNMLSNQLHMTLSTGDNKPLTALTAELKKSSDQLDIFTREFLVWLTTQQSGFRIRNEYVQVQEMFNEAEAFFSNILSWNGNKLEIETAEDIRVWTDKQLMRIVLHNLIDNANKHTENGIIRISALLKENDQLEIKVVDTGKGMTHTELEVLQNRLEDEKNQFITDSTGNLGYRIIRDFVTRLRGKIMVESLYTKGTTVTVTIPIL
ncbi:MAG: hypothetical protein J7621_06670 [Niastella sp.]|nr:hypothetical protein [Niastella sp.]